MKKAISVVLTLVMVFSSLSIAAFALEGKSITLPFVYMQDENGNDVLKYTAAVKCNGDHIPMPEDPDPADGIPPVKPECAEHTTYIFCKHGGNTEDPEIDYTISYDMSKFNAPDENGEITAVQESFFDFTVVMAEKYVQQVTVTANGAVITPNATSGRYVLPMNYSYLIEIPEHNYGEGEPTYPNFSLRRVKMTFPATGTKEGYNLYTYTEGAPGSERPNLYERQNGIYGQDYYVKLLVQDGFRECLKDVVTDAEDFDQSEYVYPVKLYASVVPNSPLPPLDAADKVYHVANIYLYKADGNTVYKYDFFDNEDDDVSEEDSNYILCGRVYKIDGEVMKSESVELTMQGITADKTNTIFNWLFRIFRMIINLLKNFKIFG